MPTDKQRDKSFNKKKNEILKQKTRMQKDAKTEIIRLLNLAQTDITNTLKLAPTDWQAYHLPQLKQSIAAALAEMETGVKADVLKRVNTANQLGLALVDEPLKAGGLNITAFLPDQDINQLNAMRAFMTDRIKDITITAANKINTQLGLVAIGAQSPIDAINTVQATLKVSRSRALGIVRTELGTVFSSATQQRMDDAKKILPGLKKKWRRSGKLHSRLHHDAADGQIVDTDKPFTLYSPSGAVTLMYPRDPAAPVGERVHCGCDSHPYMERWDVKKKKEFTREELDQSPGKRKLASATPL